MLRSSAAFGIVSVLLLAATSPTLAGSLDTLYSDCTAQRIAPMRREWPDWVAVRSCKTRLLEILRADSRIRSTGGQPLCVGGAASGESVPAEAYGAAVHAFLAYWDRRPLTVLQRQLRPDAEAVAEALPRCAS